MIIRYVVKNCVHYDNNKPELKPPKTFFWIECTPREFENKVESYFNPILCARKLIGEQYNFFLDKNYYDEPVYYGCC